MRTLIGLLAILVFLSLVGCGGGGTSYSTTTSSTTTSSSSSAADDMRWAVYIALAENYLSDPGVEVVRADEARREITIRVRGAAVGDARVEVAAFAQSAGPDFAPVGPGAGDSTSYARTYRIGYATLRVSAHRGSNTMVVKVL